MLLIKTKYRQQLLKMMPLLITNDNQIIPVGFISIETIRYFLDSCTLDNIAFVVFTVVLTCLVVFTMVTLDETIDKLFAKKKELEQTIEHLRMENEDMRQLNIKLVDELNRRETKKLIKIT